LHFPNLCRKANTRVTASSLKDRIRLLFPSGYRLLPGCSALILAAASLSVLAQATIHVPSDQSTIQAAINAAANGDTVLVSPGTYHENLDFQGKAITVASVSGPAVTIIDGGAIGPVVSFHSGELRSSVLSGFTIRNGGSEPQPSLAGAGGVYVSKSAPTVSNNIITANACHGVWVDSGAALIQGNEINQTTGTNDSCTYSGSGVLVIGSGLIGTGSQQVANNVVIGNTIEQNTTANYYDGGGLYLYAVDGSVIENNIIRNNSTTGKGGGIFAEQSQTMLIAQNLVTGNSAASGSGGISLEIPGSTQGPFVGFIQDNTIAGNTLTTSNPNGVYGSQVYIEGNLAQFEFTNNIVVGNSSSPAFMCGTTYNYLSLTPLVVDHNDIYNASGPGYGGACPDQTNTYGNIAADPLFANAASGNYQLQSGSPAIDSGNNSALQLIASNGFPLTTDLSGNPRLLDATGKGYPIVDIGAYETSGSQDAQATTIVLTPSAWFLTGGSNLTLTAQLASPAGTPTGSVAFYQDGTQVGTGTIDGAGVATLILPQIVPGTHAYLVTYGGDASFSPAISVKIYVLVEKYSVTLTLASNPNPSLVNQNVTFSITSNSPDNTHPGPITLTDNSTPLTTLTPDASGNASYSTSSLSVGSHLIVAAYAGDATHLASQQSLTQQVLSAYPTTTSLISSLNPALVGQSVTFTATVATTPVTPSWGTPSGSIAFSDNGATVTTVPLNASGVATWTTTTLPIGNHTIGATYVPTTDYAVSSATITEVINGQPDTTTLVASPNPALALAPVQLTATVTAAAGTPTGSVSFLDGGQIIGSGTLNASGVAAFTASFSTSGVHLLTARYNGDATFASGTSAPFSETIQANVSSTVLAVAPTPAGVFQPVTFTANVTSLTAPNPSSGTVTFTVAGNPIGAAPVVNGIATFTTPSINAGTWSATATYNGSGAYSASTSGPISFVIVPEATATLIAATPNPAVLGTNVTLTATVSAALGTVSGPVTFLDGSTPLGAPVPVGAGGVATFTTSSLALGTHNISASFSGSTNFGPSLSSAIQVRVYGFLGDFNVTATPPSASVYTGQSATFTVTITPHSGFNQNLALACLGSPSGATMNINPSSLSNGGGTYTVTIQTAAPQAVSSSVLPSYWPRSRWSALLVGGSFASMLLLLVPMRFRRSSRWLALLALCAALFIPGCAAPAPVSGGTPPGTYNLQLSATASNNGLTISHSVTVQLTVKSLFQ
jgi:hypothetical protein